MTSRVEWPGWFSLELPTPWVFEDGGETITMYHPDGVGALTLSAGHRSRLGPATVEEARELAAHFAKQRGWQVLDRDIETHIVDGVPVASLQYQDESGDHWELWELVDRTRVASITYVANAADADVEQQAREAIVASFKWLLPAT